MEARLNLSAAHARALEKLLALIPPDRYTWALTGSACHRLQGVDLTVHDIDIQVSGEDIYEIEKRLQGYMKTPVHPWKSEKMYSLDGKAEVEGIEIELLAEITHQQSEDLWSASFDFSRRLWLDWHDLRVPVLPLEHEAVAYDAMGRTEKAALIRKTIQELHG